MILPDDSAPISPAKARAEPLSAVPEEDRIAPPPAYPGHSIEPYRASRNVDVEAQTSSASTPLISPPPPHRGGPIKRGERAGKRFIKAFLWAVVIYLSVAWAIKGVVTIAFWRGSRKGSHDFPWPMPSDGLVHSCFGPTYVSGDISTGGVAPFSLTLPLSSDAIYLFSRGTLAHGSVEILTSSHENFPEDSVTIKIYPKGSKADLAMTNVCVVERAPSQLGVALLTPANWPKDVGGFHIEVVFSYRTVNTTFVNAFETNLPRFSHHVNLKGPVDFRSINLQSGLAKIDSTFVKAKNLTAVTSKDKITGVFHASDQLTLKTSNASVDVSAFVANDPSNTSRVLLTSNIHLLSTSAALSHAPPLPDPSLINGSFIVDIHTTNGALSAHIHDQPVDSHLQLVGTTQNAPVQVILHPAYEGTYSLRSLGGAVAVDPISSTDPSNRYRYRRSFPQQSSHSSATGKVLWMPYSGPGEGSVTLSTSVRPIQLSA
ncbi:uncharacterized protein BXZ73DRAFT_63025 [Epithele typhae]|uniref:uncharacterized protein n=1 Tax=Epithele typhae TaxID=378194 RepID=UPI0020072F99|nr:uncharacterized protein BXZ73DRAFT_63025 [Epithele typhae]KAH9896406.1 hypothetical protein BXZ73DRAFT_63025 [Epithele typhae]